MARNDDFAGKADESRAPRRSTVQPFDLPPAVTLRPLDPPTGIRVQPLLPPSTAAPASENTHATATGDGAPDEP